MLFTSAQALSSHKAATHEQDEAAGSPFRGAAGAKGDHRTPAGASRAADAKGKGKSKTETVLPMSSFDI